MIQIQQENARFKENALKYLEAQLDPEQISFKEVLLQINDDFIDDKYDYIQSKNDFDGCETHIDIIEKINDIKNVDDNPIILSNTNSSQKSRRLWTISEDTRLIATVIRYGSDNWNIISNFVGNGRNSAQCSQRWCRTLNPSISKASWTLQEENYLIQSLAKIGFLLGNQSDVQCRHHFKLISKNFNLKTELFQNNFSIFSSSNNSEHIWLETIEDENKSNENNVEYLYNQINDLESKISAQSEEIEQPRCQNVELNKKKIQYLV